MAAVLGWLLAGLGLAWALHHHRQLRHRNELVARACHEVRGPLTAASLAIHAAGRQGETPPERVAAVELELRRAGLALDDLTGALAGTRPADADERVDVAGLLTTQVEVWRAVADARGCRLRFSGPSPQVLVRGDRVRIAQATANLLANAIEHGGGMVEVGTRLVDGRVRIEVADAGPGLPATVDQLVRRPKGGRGARGRGLAIASDIAARHGGRVAAASVSGGAQVAVELPAVA